MIEQHYPAGVKTQQDRLKLLEVDDAWYDGPLEKDDGGLEPSHEDLGEIMLRTEWVVKAAAQLVYLTSVNRFNNARVPLYVPKLVSAEANPWVEMRDSLWRDGVKFKLEKSRKDYVP